MFKPSNPDFDNLVKGLKDAKTEKNNVDKDMIDYPFLPDDISDTEENIREIDNEIKRLQSKKDSEIKKLAKLKTKIQKLNPVQLRETSDTLSKKIQMLETKIDQIINDDFKTFINTMTSENTIVRTLWPDTKTTPLMDEFANDQTKDFLVLNNVLYEQDIVITKRQPGIKVANVDTPTMTELKTWKNKRSIPERIKPLLAEVSKYDKKNLKHGDKIQFDIPLPLGGQTYANQTGYGWEWDWRDGFGSCIEGTYYGEVTTFFIIGFIVNLKFVV